MLLWGIMEQVSIRDLRQHASRWLRRVHEGEAFEVTDRGRPVALLVPLPRGGQIERMIAEGKIRPAQGDLLDLGPPLPPKPGVPPLSQILEEMRAEER
jgi:prevent-host-death family protein